MSNEQLWALVAFGAIILVLSLGMWPAPRGLDGAQKYRKDRRPGKDLDPDANRWPSLGPVGVFLTALTAGSSARSGSDASVDDGGDSFDGGADDSGGE